MLESNSYNHSNTNVVNKIIRFCKDICPCNIHVPTINTQTRKHPLHKYSFWLIYVPILILIFI